MQALVLPRLCKSGVLERSGPVLRVTARFLGHLDQVAMESGAHLARCPGEWLLDAALARWDEYTGPTREGAQYLSAFLTEREQWGTLRNHVVLDAFAAA